MEFKQSGEKELANLQKQHETQVAELKVAQKGGMDKLRSEYRAKVEGMRKKHEEKIRAIQMTPKQQLTGQRQKARLIRPTIMEKQARFDEELARVIAGNTAVIAEKKATLQQEMLRLQADHNKAIEKTKADCKAALRKYALRLKREKGARQHSNPGFRALVINRIASFPPQSRQKKRPKLVLSHYQSMNIVFSDDDEFPDLIRSRAMTVFSRAPQRPGRGLDELSLSFTDHKKRDLPSIELPETDFDDSGRDRIGHKARRRMGNIRTNFDSRMNDGSVQTQRRGTGKSDVRQRTLELARAFRETVAEIEHVRQSALAALSSLQDTPTPSAHSARPHSRRRKAN
jgi:negative regulator of replication initiation